MNVMINDSKDDLHTSVQVCLGAAVLLPAADPVPEASSRPPAG